MSHDMVVTFLGTTSGGGPTDTRNCSSLVLDGLGNGDLWMVDCAEGTIRQFALQPQYGHKRIRASRVSKIFITHMHADHTMGLITFLRNILGMKPTTSSSPDPPPKRVPRLPTIDIFGPAGLRLLIRSDAPSCLCETWVDEPTEDHEREPTTLKRASYHRFDFMHSSEEPGRDIMCDEFGLWRRIVTRQTSGGGLEIDAGPILHRDPCIGYIFNEMPRPPPPSFVTLTTAPTVRPLRTLVILGDTYDPTPILPLVNNPTLPCTSLPDSTSTSPPRRISLLIHEATDAYIPPEIDTQRTFNKNRTPDSVLVKTLERGHSTPAMAGNFARLIRAEQVVLNHIGARFPAPPARPRRPIEKFRADCMREMERQCTVAWKGDEQAIGSSDQRAPLGSERHAITARDFMQVVVGPYQPLGTSEDVSASSETEEVIVESDVGLEAEVDIGTSNNPHGGGSRGRNRRKRNRSEGQEANGSRDGGRGRGHSRRGHEHSHPHQGGNASHQGHADRARGRGGRWRGSQRGGRGGRGEQTQS